jgi:hypothetical protein
MSREPKMERLNPGDERLCYPLGKPIIVPTHWVNDQSIPCLDGCPHCLSTANRRDRFYMACSMQILQADAALVWAAAVVELGECVAAYLSRYRVGSGLLIKLWRKRKCSRLFVSLLDLRAPPVVLNAPFFDVESVLRRWPGWEGFGSKKRLRLMG